MRRHGVATTLAFLVLLLPLAACAGTRSVTVTGWGAFDGRDPDEARARAIADALGRAVQEAGRTAVASETRVVNDWQVSSEVAAETFGVVRGYRVLEEGPDPGRGYRVRLLAQVATPSTDSKAAGRIVIVAREQYRGAHTPRQQLGTELARALRPKGFAVVTGEWTAPLVRVARGDVKVAADQVRALAERHDADRILVAWAEARPGDMANPNLHFARAFAKLLLLDGATGALLGTKTLADVVEGASTPARAADAALDKLRPGLALQGAVLVTAARGR